MVVALLFLKILVGQYCYLLNKYDNFYLYIDDAHGMSWTGKNGCGYVMGDKALHPKIVLTTSLGKGFGVGCGVFVMSNEEMKRKILTCGTSYTFSGPVQPPLLGAIIESAKIHLSDEITVLQKQLQKKIEFTSQIGKSLMLPEVNPSLSPIFYYALGSPRVGYSMIKNLLKEGFYTNIGIFPTVPVNCTGLRIPVTLRQTDDDLKNVLEAFAYHLPKVLEEEKISIDQISRSFKIDFAETKKKYFDLIKTKEAKSEFVVQHETTIAKIDKSVWNKLLGENGSFDWEGCKFIEETFTGNPDEESNWDMHYVIITDADKKPILATFFTVAISKDDMVSSESISKAIEKKRKTDKHYLSSKVVSMGSLITEGQHLFVDRKNANWKKSMLQLIKVMSEVKHQSGASAIQIRDIDTDDIEIKEFLLNEGFIRFDLPDSHIVVNNSWKTEEDIIDSLTKRSRKHVRRYMQRTQEEFKITFNDEINDDNLEEYYNLYLNIKRNSFKINTFDLPKSLFINAIKSKHWELLSMRLASDNKLCSFILSYKSELNNYSPMIIGLDYEYNEKYSCYRQGLFQIMKRVAYNKSKNVYLGMDASIEKQKLGAIVNKVSIYIQADDNFSFETISVLNQASN